MLKNQMKNVLTNMVNGGKLEIYKEEKEYVEKQGLIEGNITLIEKEADSRFSDAYIERSDKETEEVIGVEGQAFLNQPINYFKKHMNEFLYLESNWFEIIGVDVKTKSTPLLYWDFHTHEFSHHYSLSLSRTNAPPLKYELLYLYYFPASTDSASLNKN